MKFKNKKNIEKSSLYNQELTPLLYEKYELLNEFYTKQEKQKLEEKYQNEELNIYKIAEELDIEPQKFNKELLKKSKKEKTIYDYSISRISPSGIFNIYYWTLAIGYAISFILGFPLFVCLWALIIPDKLFDIAKDWESYTFSKDSLKQYSSSVFLEYSEKRGKIEISRYYFLLLDLFIFGRFIITGMFESHFIMIIAYVLLFAMMYKLTIMIRKIQRNDSIQQKKQAKFHYDTRERVWVPLDYKYLKTSALTNILLNRDETKK